MYFIPQVDVNRGVFLRNVENTPKSFSKIFSQELLNSECIYTNGSKKPGSEFCGFAIIYKDSSLFYRSKGFLSTFSIEAILEALNLCSKHEVNSFTIFSDSKSVLLTLMTTFRPNKHSHLILLIKDKIRLLEIKKGKNISLIWIPGHRDIPGNKSADQATKEAIKEGIDSQIGIPLRDFKNCGKEQMFEDFFTFCKNLGKEIGITYFNYFHFRHRMVFQH